MRPLCFFLFSASLVGACAEGSNTNLGNGVGGEGGRWGSGGASATSSTSSSSGEGGGGGAGGGGGSGGSVSMCMYAAPNTCAAGVMIAEVPGDDGAVVQTQFGTTSQWLTVRIVETKFDPVDQNKNHMSYTVTLQSPPGMDFDVYVQEGPNDGGAVCNGVPKKGTGTSGTETVKSSWNDNTSFGDDKDDHRYLSIEVRYVSGTKCGAEAQWKLTIAGHT